MQRCVRFDRPPGAADPTASPVWAPGSARGGDPPAVSVIVPFCGAHETLPQTLRSIQRQTWPDLEIVLVNDGDPQPGSRAFLEGLAADDPRTRVVHKPNGGLASARNAGLAAARGEWVYCLDADDLISPTCVEQLLWAARHVAGDVFYTDAVHFGDEQCVERLDAASHQPQQLVQGNYLTYAALIRRSAALRIGGWDERNFPRGLEDWDFWLRLMCDGARFVHCRGPHFWYRRRAGSMLQRLLADPPAFEQAAARVRSHAAGRTFAPGQMRDLDWLGVTAHPRLAEPCDAVPSATPFGPPQRRRVLLIVPYLDVGGADRFNLELVTRADPQRFGFSIVTTDAIDPPGWHPWHARFTELTDDVFHLPDFLPLAAWGRFLVHLIRTRRIDTLLISNSTAGYRLLPWLRRHCPALRVVDYLHAAAWYWHGGSYARWSSETASCLDRTLTASQTLRATLLRDYGRDPQQVEAAPIGTDARGTFDPQALARGRWRAAHGLDAERPAILFLARLHPVKRPRLLLAIAAELRRRIGPEGFYVWIVGEGPLAAAVAEETRTAGLDDVVRLFAGPEDARPCYRDADVLVNCSIAEGLALTLYEAMAMGLPVVSGDVGGHREALTSDCGVIVRVPHDERTITDEQVFTVDEVRSFADALEPLLRDPGLRQRLGAAARRRILAEYDQPRLFARIYDVLSGPASAAHQAAWPEAAARAYAELGLEAIRTQALLRIAWRAEAEFHAASQRAQHAAEELAAMRATRAWRLIERYRRTPLLYSVGRRLGLTRPARAPAAPLAPPAAAVSTATTGATVDTGGPWSAAERAVIERLRTEPEAAVAFHVPHWLGVSNATRNLFAARLPVAESPGPADIDRLVRLLREAGARRLVYSGFPAAWESLVEAVRDRLPKVRQLALLHASVMQNREEESWRVFQALVRLARRGDLRCIGVVKKGMAEDLARCGVTAAFVENCVPPQVHASSSPQPGGPHLGLWLSGEVWRKPSFAQLAAAARVPPAVVHGAGLSPQAVEFAAMLGLTLKASPHPVPAAVLARQMAQMHLNLYVTLTECAPLLPLESLSLGVPCLIGPTSHWFEDEPFLHERLVVPYPDRPEIIAEYIVRALAERRGIVEAYLRWAPQQLERSRQSVRTFLDLAG